MAYNVERSDGSEQFFVEDGQVDSGSVSITLVGKNVINYGLYQNENFLKILENFSNDAPPISPSTGQLWYDNTTAVSRLKVFNGTTWDSVPNFLFTSTVTVSEQNSYDFWYDTDIDQLYAKSPTGYVLIGGRNAASYSADKLSTPVTINGVSFDGSDDIEVKSSTTSVLTRGTYLTGNSFDGTTATTWAVDVGTVSSAQGGKVVARDSSGDIWYNVGHGVSTSARYADLAEKYLADAEYAVGTVVSVGGNAEVTASQFGDRAIGVVSDNPAFMMNRDLEGGTYIALKGRVPVKISGIVEKGQQLVAGDNGCALPATYESRHLVFAIALESSEGKTEIEAVIL